MSKDTKNTLTIDVERYQHFLDNSDIPQEQKEELLRTLWSVVCEFITIGWQVTEAKSCGEEFEHASNSIQRDSSDIDSKSADHVETNIKRLETEPEGV